MESIALKNPEEVLQKLNELSDEMAEAKYEYKLIDENGKNIFSKLCLHYRNQSSSMSEAEKRAYADKDWLEYTKGLAAASSKFEKIKARFNNYVSYIEYMRSYLSCQKHLN